MATATILNFTGSSNVHLRTNVVQTLLTVHEMTSCLLFSEQRYHRIFAN